MPGDQDVTSAYRRIREAICRENAKLYDEATGTMWEAGALAQHLKNQENSK